MKNSKRKIEPIFSNIKLEEPLWNTDLLPIIFSLINLNNLVKIRLVSREFQKIIENCTIVHEKNIRKIIEDGLKKGGVDGNDFDKFRKMVDKYSSILISKLIFKNIIVRSNEEFSSFIFKVMNGEKKSWRFCESLKVNCKVSLIDSIHLTNIGKMNKLKKFDFNGCDMKNYKWLKTLLSTKGLRLNKIGLLDVDLDHNDEKSERELCDLLVEYTNRVNCVEKISFWFCFFRNNEFLSKINVKTVKITKPSSTDWDPHRKCDIEFIENIGKNENIITFIYKVCDEFDWISGSLRNLVINNTNLEVLKLGGFHNVNSRDLILFLSSFQENETIKIFEFEDIYYQGMNAFQSIPGLVDTFSKSMKELSLDGARILMVPQQLPQIFVDFAEYEINDQGEALLKTLDELIENCKRKNIYLEISFSHSENSFPEKIINAYLKEKIYK